MSDQRRYCGGFLLPTLLVLAAMAALSVDVPIARPFHQLNEQVQQRPRTAPLPTAYAYLGYLTIFEPFGHGLGVLLAVIMLHQLDPVRRWAIPRVAVCALGAGGAADLLKMLVMRTRPNDFNFVGSVWTTFRDWLPGWNGGSGAQSFPSAHTATAVGLAAALIWLYPQGRFLFTLLAVLVGCQRIASGAHFPSDVLMGAAAGCLVATLLLQVGRLPRWFSGWEARWRSK
jgi:membrane-associated phospholipid phosphatase